MSDSKEKYLRESFEKFWSQHQKQLILHAPEDLRNDYMRSTQMDTPADWVCFIIPVCVGIFTSSLLKIQSQILSWVVTIVVIVVLFAVMQIIKPHFSKKKSTADAIRLIKEYYFGIYKKTGDLSNLDTWHV